MGWEGPVLRPAERDSNDSGQFGPVRGQILMGLLGLLGLGSGLNKKDFRGLLSLDDFRSVLRSERSPVGAKR